MSELLKKYLSTDSNTVIRAREQSDGKRSVNYYDINSEFQKEFTTRSPGDKETVRSNSDDDTTGTWTERALKYYGEHVDKFAGLFHKYDRRKNDSHYIEQNKESPGVARFNRS